MEEKELTEVPLSNREVLKVLKARNNSNEGKHHSRTIEMMEYLDSIEKGVYKYPLEILRELKTTKNLDADLLTLAIVSNISDINILNNSDKKKIQQYFLKSKRKNY